MKMYEEFLIFIKVLVFIVFVGTLGSLAGFYLGWWGVFVMIPGGYILGWCFSEHIL